MKANAPEKIYLQPSTIEELPYQNIVYIKPLADNSIEYIRTDAFIEKAEEYLYKQLNEGNMECGDIETFIEVLKNYMKGE